MSPEPVDHRIHQFHDLIQLTAIFLLVASFVGPPQVWGCEGQSGIFASVV
jgi:hypothetical protein